MSRELLQFQGYAKGAIRTRAALLDLVIEARKGKKAIRLYTVEQGGHRGELFLTSKSTLTVDERTGFTKVNYWARSSYGGARYYKSERCTGDLNIPEKDGRNTGHNRHQMFSNKRSADEYAAALKADKGYLQAVADWHKHCDKMFGRFGF